MTIKSDFGEVHLDVDPGTRPSATMLEPETPFRILLLGDFSGRSSTSWKPVEVDRDNLEEVLARVGPGFSGMRFQQLDDFHPDRIYAQSGLFQGLREMRRKLETPSTFTEAAAEIRAWSPEPAPPAGGRIGGCHGQRGVRHRAGDLPSSSRTNLAPSGCLGPS